MDLFAVKPSGYRHPADPSQRSKQTWGLVAVVVLLFASGIG
jgi:hypothetical protein